MVDVWALDFDGVLCDSAYETGMTGWRAARTLISGLPDLPPSDFAKRFSAVRPMLMTGYEAIIMAQLIDRDEDARISQDFAAASSQFMSENQTSVDELKALFGAT